MAYWTKSTNENRSCAIYRSSERDEQAQSLQLIEDSNLNDYSGFARFAMPVLNLVEVVSAN